MPITEQVERVCHEGVAPRPRPGAGADERARRSRSDAPLTLGSTGTRSVHAGRRAGPVPASRCCPAPVLRRAVPPRRPAAAPGGADAYGRAGQPDPARLSRPRSASWRAASCLSFATGHGRDHRGCCSRCCGPATAWCCRRTATTRPGRSAASDAGRAAASRVELRADRRAVPRRRGRRRPAGAAGDAGQPAASTSATSPPSAAAAHAAGALVAVDNTTATPLGQRPLALGARPRRSASDTKALTGHCDLLLGHVAPPTTTCCAAAAGLADAAPAASRARSRPGWRTARWPPWTCGWPGRRPTRPAVADAAARRTRRSTGGPLAGAAGRPVATRWPPRQMRRIRGRGLVRAAVGGGGGRVPRRHPAGGRGDQLRRRCTPRPTGGPSGATTRRPGLRPAVLRHRGHRRPGRRPHGRAWTPPADATGAGSSVPATGTRRPGRVHATVSQQPRKTRVAVVFGGRSTEHAISARQRRQHPGRARPRRVRGGAGRHHPRGSLGAHQRRPGVAGHQRPRAARDHRRSGHRRRAARRPDRRRAGRARAGRGRARAGRRRRGLPGPARRLRRGRHHPGPAGDGRRAVRRRPACSPRRPRWTRSSPRSCCRRRGHPGRAVRGAPAGQDAVREADTRAARAAGLRQAGPGRVVARHHQGRPTGPSSTRRSPTRARSRPEGARRGGDRRAARSSAACWRARPAARRRPACWPRSGWSAATSSTTSRPSTSTTPASSTSRPTCPAQVTGRGAGAAPAARSPRWTAPAWPGSTSSSRPSWSLPQRDQHHARLHPDLDVPADVGGVRAGLPEAGLDRLIRTALRPRHRPAADPQRSQVRSGAASGSVRGSRGRALRARLIAVDSRAGGSLTSSAGDGHLDVDGAVHRRQRVVAPRRSANQVTPLITSMSAVAQEPGRPAARRSAAPPAARPRRAVRRGAVAPAAPAGRRGVVGSAEISSRQDRWAATGSAGGAATGAPAARPARDGDGDGAGSAPGRVAAAATSTAVSGTATAVATAAALRRDRVRTSAPGPARPPRGGRRGR